MAKRDGIYTPPGRKGYWISWVDAQGRRRRRKTEAQSLYDARLARSAELQKVEQAKMLGFTPPGADTFEQVAKRFLTYQKARLTHHAYEREKGIVEGQLTDAFKVGKLASIRRLDVQRYVTKRMGEGLSAHTVQKELNVLKHLMRLAVEWEIIPINHAHGVKSPKVPAGRVRYLQPKELKALVKACPKWLRPIVALAVCTGMRRGEILGLRWLDVDLEHHRLLLPQTKNGESRIVYLNDSATAALKSLKKPKKPTEHLFKSCTPEQVSMTFIRVCRDKGISNFRFHDLRHTAASWLRMQGADIHTVAQLLGHKDLRMAARYQHLSPQFLAEAVSRLDGVYGLLSHHSVTTTPELNQANSASA